MHVCLMPKCIACQIHLDEGEQYIGHMAFEHEYPNSWLEKVAAKLVSSKADKRWNLLRQDSWSETRTRQPPPVKAALSKLQKKYYLS